MCVRVCVCVCAAPAASASCPFTYTREPQTLNHPFISACLTPRQTHTHATPWPGRWLCHPCQSSVTTHTHKHTDTQMKGRRQSVSAASPGQREAGINRALYQSIMLPSLSLSFSLTLHFALWGPPFMPTCYSCCFILYSASVTRCPLWCI